MVKEVLTAVGTNTVVLTCSLWFGQVSMPWHPPTVLLGHSQEVTSVCWCPSDFTKVCGWISITGFRKWMLDLYIFPRFI